MSGPVLLSGRVAPLTSLAYQERNVVDKTYGESVLLGLLVGGVAYYFLASSSVSAIAIGGLVVFLAVQSGLFGGDALGSATSSATVHNKGIWARGTAALEEAVRQNASYSNYFDIAAGGNTVRQ
jgi:hypothetical protein